MGGRGWGVMIGVRLATAPTLTLTSDDGAGHGCCDGGGARGDNERTRPQQRGLGRLEVVRARAMQHHGRAWLGLGLGLGLRSGWKLRGRARGRGRVRVMGQGEGRARVEGGRRSRPGRRAPAPWRARYLCKGRTQGWVGSASLGLESQRHAACRSRHERHAAVEPEQALGRAPAGARLRAAQQWTREE